MTICMVGDAQQFVLMAAGFLMFCVGFIAVAIFVDIRRR